MQINDEASDKVLAVEQEANGKRRPVYKKRNAIIATVPHFWLQTLSGHPVIREMCTDDDNAVLEHCVEVGHDLGPGFWCPMRRERHSSVCAHAGTVCTAHCSQGAAPAAAGLELRAAGAHERASSGTTLELSHMK